MGRKSAAVRQARATVAPAPLRLDLGCGPHKRDGFHGVDRIPFDGVDTVIDLSGGAWPWADSSISEAHSSHFLEHLTATQRVTFCNELYRVLVPGGSCQLVVPHWASCRAYGDPTHQWPPVSEFWFYYLNRDWRAANAPHTDIAHNPEGFACHLEATWGYTMRPDLQHFHEERRQFALENYIETKLDLIATLKALKG